MKTYSASGREKTPKKVKIIYSIVALVSVGIIALSVVLASTFSTGDDLAVNAPIVNTPDDGQQKPDADEPVKDTGAIDIKFNLPVTDGTVIRPASIEKLVYMPSLNMWRTHNGVDFSAKENAPILVVADGTIDKVEQTTLEGMVVTVSHENGVTSIYKSLQSASVKAGDKVKGGDQIGVAGTMLTESSDGVHLHLEMTIKGKTVDPLSYLDAEIDK